MSKGGRKTSRKKPLPKPVVRRHLMDPTGSRFTLATDLGLLLRARNPSKKAESTPQASPRSLPFPKKTVPDMAQSMFPSPPITVPGMRTPAPFPTSSSSSGGHEDKRSKKALTKSPKMLKSNEEISECFKLEPVEKPVAPRFLDESTEQIDTKPIEQYISENKIQHITTETVLENEINEVLKKAYNNLKSKAQIKTELLETIIISENSDEDVIDKSDSSLYSLVNVFNDTKNRNTIVNKDERQTNDVHDTNAIDLQKNELTDKDLLKSKDKKLTSNGLSTFKPEILYSEKILNEVDVISKTSTNLIDKILAIEIRNCFGRYKFVALEESKQDIMLNEAFQRWNEWQAVTKVRGVPLCYKCYVCEIAFWHLHPFREHIRTHESIEINIETQASECSIIAFETEVEFQTFHIDSDCWRCGNDFKSHPTLMYPNGEYRCCWCNELFFTCTALKIHENVCTEFLNKRMNAMINARSLQCSVCPLVVWQENELAIHMELSHSVRSDLPIAGATVQLCKYCNQKSMCRLSHTCNRKYSTHSCLHCNRLFPAMLLLNMHMQSSSTEYKCPNCDMTLPKQCMMAEHLTTHSENFQTIYRSVVCNKICQNKVTAKDHNWRQHRKKINRKCKLYDTIIVLRKTMECITPLEADPYSPCKVVCAKVTKKRNNISRKRIYTAKESDVIEEHNPIVTVTPQNTIDNEDNDIINIYDDVFIKEEIDLDLNDENDSINGEMVIDTEQEEYNVDNEESTSVVSDLHQSEDLDKGIVNEGIIDLCDDDTVQSNNLGHVNNVNVRNGPKMYKCKHCGFHSYHKQYKEHIEVCHRMSLFKEINKSKKQKINCTKCSQHIQRFKTLKKYLYHLHKVHNLDKFKCPECREVSNSFSSLELHLYVHVEGLFERQCNSHYVCNKCKMPVNVVDVFAHWETHMVLPGDVEEDSDDGTMKDEQSGSGSLGAEVLKKLIQRLTTDTTKSSHANRMKIKTCPHCKREFTTFFNAKRHIIEHLLADAYTGFMRVGALKCQICSDTYKKGEQYKQHMRDHANLQIYLCEICNKTFCSPSNILKHRKTHNIGVLICDICKRKYHEKMALIKHLETHNKEKPVCTICGKSYHSQTVLKKHIKFKHDLVPRYACRVCGQRFVTYKEKLNHNHNDAPQTN